MSNPGATRRGPWHPFAFLCAFWVAWQEELATSRILDPACGSGAFLIEAFDQLQAANERLEMLRGHAELLDLNREILQKNLYGVDLNDEAVEIRRLSPWIKTARPGKVLTALDHTIRAGNSLIADPAFHPRAFDWQPAFPEALASDGIICDESVFDDPEWRFQPREITGLFNRLMDTAPPLREVCGGRMYRGVLTGLNEAFIVDTPTRDRLVAEDPAREPLLKRVLKGEDLRP